MEHPIKRLLLLLLKKSAINHFLIYTCMVICYMPLYILLTLHSTHQSYKLWKNEWNFATTLVLMNSSINPFLYCWRIGELRRAVVTTAKEMLCWKVSERVTLQDTSQGKNDDGDIVKAGVPNENIVQNHLNVALLNVF